ncbi:HAMP domain-containing protein, partial [Klebsiella pneumoniae]|nr:HAMP domain-containing protein [Klebsiella pneumoniae]
IANLLQAWQLQLSPWSALAMGVSLAIVVNLWLSLRRNVLRPLERATDFTRRLAGGDLTGRIDHVADNEMGQLVAALRQTSV